jgi:hypothetical protein
MAGNRNTVTFDTLESQWHEDNRDAGHERICAFCGEFIVIGDDRYIVDDDHVHVDCFRGYAVESLDAIEGNGE